MDKQIPIYFDSVIVSSPFKEISDANPNIGRLKVRVFTKYGNRNGSYITDAVANQLIESATSGTVPVVGFFDPETSSWASHSGPTLANAYGYVENFLGWEPFEDTDGVSRDYAVFSVILFTDYFQEAQKILGENQSMEIDPESITGDWTVIDNQEYYVYKTAKMLGFCVIGQHEPCFSVSAFFSKNDDTYNTQYEKFSSLLFDLKAKVEEAEKTNKGGEHTMDNEVMTPVEESVVVDEVQTSEEATVTEAPFQENEQSTEEQPVVTEESTTVEEPVAVEEPESEPVTEPEQETEPSEFEVLQQKFNELQEKFNATLDTIEALKSANESSVETIMSLRTQNEQLQATISTYEQQVNEAELIRKNELVEKYEKNLEEEEIRPFKEGVKNFSYDELESKLAIMFANKQLSGNDVKKVQLPQTPEESQFAALMRKYRK